MMKRDVAIALHGLKTNRSDRDKTRDNDLAMLQEVYPELSPVFEELQKWRNNAT
jgi:hypothetical protein